MSRLFPKDQGEAPMRGPITRDQQPQRSPLELVRPDRVQSPAPNSPKNVPNAE
jgi:hypothetical protein